MLRSLLFNRFWATPDNKKIGETTFAISAIPLGGYVEVAGNAEIGQGEQLQAHAKGDRSFTVQTLLAKTSYYVSWHSL